MDDSWAAYQLDLACLTLGRWVENKLSERTKSGSGKRAKWVPRYSLGQLLDETGGGGYRSLKGMARKAQVRPDGTWEVGSRE